MSRFTPPIRRKDTARGHHYVDAAGRRVPGVTTILGDGIPKPALVNWAANSTADAAINRWDELAEMKPAQRLAALKSARYEEKDAAANRGTQVHHFAEQLLAGQAVQVPDEIAGHVEAYARFLDEWQVRPVLVEFAVVSHRYGYAGTADLLADLTDPATGETFRTLADLKTNRSGIFGETALQLAAYRYADAVLGPDGTEQPVPVVDGCHGIHVRGDGYCLVPITAGPEQHRTFLYAQQIAEWASGSRDLVGPPMNSMTPPSTYRLVRGDR